MKPDIEEVLSQYNLAKKFLNKRLRGVDMEVCDVVVTFENYQVKTELFNKQKFLIILLLVGGEQYIFDPENPPKLQQPVIRVEQQHTQYIFTARLNGDYWNFDDGDDVLSVTTYAIKTAYEFMKSIYSDSHSPSPEIQSVIINSLIFPYSVLESMFNIQNENQ